MLSLLLAASFLVAPPAAPAPRIERATPIAANFDASPENLDELLQPIRKRHDVPGMGVAVLTADRLVGLGVSGVRVRGEDAPIERGDRFHLGSCTKAVTATLAAQLVAEGKLQWDSTVGAVLGPTVPTMRDEWKAVTLDELLHHRSGAPAAPDRKDWQIAWSCTASPQECRAAFVASMLSRPPAQSRGSYAYSNQGYAIAGRMCELAAQRDWESLVVERIAAPLGITSAGFGSPSIATHGKAPKGHDAQGAVKDTDNPNAIAPAGTLHLSLADWARFISVHLRGEKTALLGIAPDGFLHLHSAPAADENHYACGWGLADRAWGGHVLSHSGSNTVWFCVAWLAPAPPSGPPFAVLVACNQGGDEAAKAADEAASAAITWWTANRSRASEQAAPADDRR
ncbi:MAG: serine hydrolase domain-containing protein [Phycisphaerales bacterium]